MRNSTRGYDNEDVVRRNGNRERLRGEGKEGKEIKTKERQEEKYKKWKLREDNSERVQTRTKLSGNMNRIEDDNK